jgi:glycosyltransferase involved in cell wall biosynthesis
VIIPTYNRADLLKNAIASVLDQTFQDFELIILDNGSTDNTEEIVKSFCSEKIKYFKNERNIGWLSNSNKAFEVAQSLYMIIFHDDDIMKPNLLEREVAILDNDKEVVLVAANIEVYDENGKMTNENMLSLISDQIYTQYEFAAAFFDKGIFLPFPTVMFRTQFMQEHQLRFQAEVGACADAFMWHQVNSFPQKIYLIADRLLKYRKSKCESIQQDSAIGKNYINQFQLYKSLFYFYKKLNNQSLQLKAIKAKNYFLNLLFNDLELENEKFLRKKAAIKLKLAILLATRCKFGFKLFQFIISRLKKIRFK